MNTFRMLVRREYWEHRMLWITPLVVAALLLLAVMGFGSIHADNLHVEADFGSGPAPFTADVFGFITLAMSMPFYLAAAILAFIYLADCLYAERRDRSILFWKSLPVSDRATVLAKLFTALIMIPLGCFLAAALTSIGAGIVVSIRSALGLIGNLPAWDTGAWLHAKGIELYALLVVVLWYAPYAGYLLLASAWARRPVYVWAIIPPLLLAMLERTVFGTAHVWGVLRRSLGDLFRLAFSQAGQINHTIGAPTAGPDPAALLANPQLWVGLVLAAAMIWGAIVLRRRAAEA